MKQTVDHFCSWVRDALQTLVTEDRRPLVGNYLFVIDQKPSFMLTVALENIDIQILSSEKKEKKPTCRSEILTDSLTLSKLLNGVLKAHIAFVTKKILISGDLPAFLKMASYLKQKRTIARIKAL